jgi:hypothetical protein
LSGKGRSELKLSGKVDECKPLPLTRMVTRDVKALEYPTTVSRESNSKCLQMSVPHARGLQSFTLELNLSNSRTDS